MDTEPPQPQLEDALPKVPRLVEVFVESLTADKVSNFFCWFLYYDVVILPETPHRWFKMIPPMDMQGWIALGTFLGTQVSHELGLVKWNGIRDRLGLGQTAESCLKQLGNHEEMNWTQLAAIIKAAERQDQDELQKWRAVQAKLRDLLCLALRLRPSSGTTFTVWRQEIIERAKGFLWEIVDPEVITLKNGTPKVSTKSEEERAQLKYLFEAMQQERQVPLARYGILPLQPSLDATISSSKSESGVPPRSDDDLLEKERQAKRSFSTRKLKSENRLLRNRNFQLEIENRRLVESNEKLTRKIATIERIQPALNDTSARRTATPPNFTSPQTPVADEMPFPSSSATDLPPLPFGFPRAQGRNLSPHLGDSSTIVEPSIHSSAASECQDVFHDFDSTTPPVLPVVEREAREEIFRHPPASPRGLIRSPAMHNLTIVVTPPTSPGLGPRGASPRSPKQQIEPSGNNSMAEYLARQVNESAIQCPIAPYQEQSGGVRRLRSVRSFAGLVRRRTDDPVENEENTKTKLKRSDSLGEGLGRLLGSFRSQRSSKEERTWLSPDMSTNF